MPQSNLKNEYHLDKVNPVDWMSIAGLHLRFCKGSGTTEVLFFIEQPKDADCEKYFFRLEFFNTGNVKELVAGPSFSSQVAQKLRDSISEILLKESARGIAFTVLFSRIPVRKKYRYKNFLQLMPVPEHSPQCPMPFGDHPFILEFSLGRTGDLGIDSERWRNHKERLSYFLNLVLRGGVASFSSRSESTWVAFMQERHSKSYKLARTIVNALSFLKQFKVASELWQVFDNGLRHSHWFQIGYDLADDTREMFIDNMTEAEAFDEMSRQEDQQYYSKGIGIHDEMDVPLGMEHYLNCYEKLNVTDSEVFFRATYWYYQATKNLDSDSISFVALVTAIESFLPKPRTTHKCDSCGQDVKDESITEKFRKFIDKFASGITDQQKNIFYSMRSKVVHGDQLLLSDFGKFRISMTPQGRSEFRNFDLCRQVVRVAILNWLRSGPNQQI